jgi:hypothetical protein
MLLCGDPGHPPGPYWNHAYTVPHSNLDRPTHVNRPDGHAQPNAHHHSHTLSDDHSIRAAVSHTVSDVYRDTRPNRHALSNARSADRHGHGNITPCDSHLHLHPRAPDRHGDAGDADRRLKATP